MGSDTTSARPLSAMELNNIKLDIKHTVLTPQYLENLIQNKNTEENRNQQ